MTLASADVFAAFEGPAKTDALLHGHSYTAHPIGCAAAVAALDLYADPQRNPRQCRPPTQAQVCFLHSSGTWSVSARRFFPCWRRLPGSYS